MCQHENFFADVVVNRIVKDEDSNDPNRWQAEVRISCMDCGLPFRFIGLPIGMDFNGASVSVDGQEGRFSIAPKGHVLTPLDEGSCSGFTVRRTESKDGR